jgi:hypothetical protein
MNKPKLYRPKERTRAEIEGLLLDSDPMVVYRAIIDAANYEPDWRWLQQRCVDLLQMSRDKTVRTGAIHGIQFLTAARGEIDPDVVMPALLEAQNEPDLAGTAQGALNDIYSLSRGKQF